MRFFKISAGAYTFLGPP